MSLFYGVFLGNAKVIDLILFATVLGCIGLFLPFNILVIDKRKSLIHIKKKHFLTMVGSTYQCEELKVIEIKKGLGSTGSPFLSFNLKGKNVTLIEPDILPGHVKKMTNIKTNIEHFLLDKNNQCSG